MIRNKKRELELYIHIPFCVQKCKYCDFLSAPAATQVQNAYMEALLTEIGAWEDASADAAVCEVISVFIGGGTPTTVAPEWIERVMEAVRSKFVLRADAEITMEMNPGTVTKEGIGIYKRAGINRLSIGCQSAKDEELQCIGRIHTFEQFLDTYKMVREAGFQNVNVDLMSGLPGQSLRDWEESLRRIVALNPAPEHISAYSLIVEEGTPFYELYEKGELILPDEETERRMYWKTGEILAEYGYEQYEISNYAKPGYACKHNCGYWIRKDYLGFGIGAASLYQNTRFRNGDSLADYLKNPIGIREDIQKLTQKEQMEETMFLGLRLARGINRTDFEDAFGVPVETIYEEQIKESIEEGLLEYRGNNLALSRRGIDVSNFVMAKFLQD